MRKFTKEVINHSTVITNLFIIAKIIRVKFTSTELGGSWYQHKFQLSVLFVPLLSWSYVSNQCGYKFNTTEGEVVSYIDPNH